MRVKSWYNIRQLSRRLHCDRGGDIPVGAILVIGLVVIPLVLFLVIFRVELWTGLADAFVDIDSADGKIKF